MVKLRMAVILIPVICCLVGGGAIALLMQKGMDEQDSNDPKEG